MVAEREQTLEERHAEARERWLAHYEGDPEMQEIVRKAKFGSRRRRRTPRTFASRTNAGIRACSMTSKMCCASWRKSFPTRQRTCSPACEVSRQAE